MERKEKLADESLLDFAITHFNLRRSAQEDVTAEVLRMLGLQKNRYMHMYM